MSVMNSKTKYLLLGTLSFCIGIGFNKRKYSNQKVNSRNQGVESDRYYRSELKFYRNAVGYHFDKKGNLIDKKGNKFKYQNSKNYENVATYANLYVEYELVKKGFQKILLPLTDNTKEERERKSEIFVYEKKENNEDDKTLVLLQGNGKVECGVWSRKIIINDNLNKGSMLPMIDKAINEGYNIIYVMNPNKNYEDAKDIKYNENPFNHLLYVWDNLISKHSDGSVDIVAHSYGGASVVNLIKKRTNNVSSKIHKIAFTDSVHISPVFLSEMRLNKTQKSFLSQNSRNWIRSTFPLDYFVGKRGLVDCFSAGHELHEYTTHSSTDSIFKYFNSDI